MSTQPATQTAVRVASLAGAAAVAGSAPPPSCVCLSGTALPVRTMKGPAGTGTPGREWGFVAPAVHQLRTPLTSILSFADLILARVGDASDRAEWTGHIRSQALRMKASLNSLLSVSEIETGRLVLRPSPVDVRAVFRELVRVTRACAPDVRITGNVGEGASWARADEPRFHEIMWNLVDNAVKYSAGGGTVSITASRTGDGMVAVEVSDSGPGIAPERVPDLFKPFHRAAGTRGTARGTGLGLYVVKTLTEMHGGAVSVSSIPGAGTTFAVTLPSASPATHEAAFEYVDAPAAARAQGDDLRMTEDDAEFMRWISYELRAPLTPLLAAAELLAEPRAPRVRRSQWLRRIRTLAVRMKCLTDAIMTASQLRSATVAVERRPFDIATVFASVVGQTAPLVEGHRVVTSADPGARDVLGDQQRTSDVLVSLVESAARVSTDQSEVSLAAHEVPGSGHVAICVTFQASISQPPATAPDARPGLGLQVAQQLAELQGGSLEQVCTPSGAMSFRLTLQRA